MWHQVCPKPREDKTQSLPVVNVLLNITKTSKQVKAEKNVRNRGVSRNEMTAFQSRFYHPVCWTQGNEFKEIYCNEIWKTLIQSDVHFDNKTRYIENSSPQSGQKIHRIDGHHAPRKLHSWYKLVLRFSLSFLSLLLSLPLQWKRRGTHNKTSSNDNW